MRKFGFLTAAVVAVGLMALASPARAETTVTKFAPFSQTPIPGQWFEFNVQPGGTATISDLSGLGAPLEPAPLPTGAALLITDLTDAAKAEVGVANNYGTPGDIFSTLNLSYEFFKADDGTANAAAAPSLKLTIFNLICDDPGSDGDCFGTLVYEHNQQETGNPPLATWTLEEIDHDTGLFWWTGGFGQPSGGGGCPCRTLDGWSALFSSDFDDADVKVVSIGVGTFNQGQIGYFDAVHISHAFGNGYDVTYDFEFTPFETVGECITTSTAEICSALTGRDRAICNLDEQMACFDLFNVE